MTGPNEETIAAVLAVLLIDGPGQTSAGVDEAVDCWSRGTIRKALRELCRRGQVRYEDTIVGVTTRRRYWRI